VQPWHAYGIGFDVPVLASINVSAAVLSVAAVLAVFRFKVGMLTTLAACTAAGLALHALGWL
jgi:chromate transporter